MKRRKRVIKGFAIFCVMGMIMAHAQSEEKSSEQRSYEERFWKPLVTEVTTDKIEFKLIEVKPELGPDANSVVSFKVVAVVNSRVLDSLDFVPKYSEGDTPEDFKKSLAIAKKEAEAKLHKLNSHLRKNQNSKFYFEPFNRRGPEGVDFMDPFLTYNFKKPVITPDKSTIMVFKSRLEECEKREKESKNNTHFLDEESTNNKSNH